MIRPPSERITEVVSDLTNPLAKFNPLVTNHNDVIARYNELVKKTTTPPAAK
jgi:hypothetical protein